MVSTTKEGLFKPNSTMIFEMPCGQLDPRRPVAKLIYTPSLTPADRLQAHDTIAQLLDNAVESMTLGGAIAVIFDLLKDRDIVAEATNIAT